MRNALRASLRTLAVGLLAILGAACSSDPGDDARPEPTGEAFETPEAAIHTFASAVGGDDVARLEQIFGADGLELLRSGDPFQDRQDAEHACELIAQKLSFEEGPGGCQVAQMGEDGFPFAIPLVRTEAGWRFDVVTGAEEVDNRRIGRNELSTIATLRAYVDAQREYQAVPRDGRPRAYAQRLLSSPGMHDGLYWPTAEGEPESPFGPLVAEAAKEGRTQRAEGEEPRPYHGYHYRLLKAQGARAPGGAQSYVDANGLLTGGYAAVAWPSKYDSSGIMTFVVNHRGIVFQKDLGEETDQIAEAMTEYEPDDTWDPVDED